MFDGNSRRPWVGLAGVLLTKFKQVKTSIFNRRSNMLKHGMLENFMVDSHSGFVFLTKRFQLWSAAKLDIILHRIVYDYNSIEVANAIIEGTFLDFL